MHYHNKGFILVEANIALLIIVCMVMVFDTSFKTLILGWQKMQADLKLYDSARCMLALPEKEAFLDVHKLSIVGDGKNDKLICEEVFGERRVIFYVNNGNLYRETRNGDKKGVNILSSKDCQVLEFITEKINKKEVFLMLILEDRQSKRILKVKKRVFLCNGFVE